MSRSRKKPYFTDQQGGCTKQVKRLANRAIRQLPILEEDDLISDGKQYRKQYCSWSIRDYSFHCPNNKKAYRK